MPECMICAFVVRLQQSLIFSHRGPYIFRVLDKAIMVLSATISYAPQLTLLLFMYETRSGLFYIGNNVFEKKIMVSEESKNVSNSI